MKHAVVLANSSHASLTAVLVAAYAEAVHALATAGCGQSAHIHLGGVRPRVTEEAVADQCGPDAPYAKP